MAGTSGAATYNSTTGVLNVPNYADTDTGITSLNGLTALTQTFAVGTSGTDFGISSATSTHTFNLPTASATNRGALSSADWTTFNAKQTAGNYITALTGEASASGPGSSAITLTNSAVIGKILTGLNVTGGSVSATDSIVDAFGNEKTVRAARLQVLHEGGEKALWVRGQSAHDLGGHVQGPRIGHARPVGARAGIRRLGIRPEGGLLG